jgi:hypothetical protein
MLPDSTDDLWYTIMDLDHYAVPIEKQKKGEDKWPSNSAPVSRFGALLAAAILRLPGDTDYRMIEEYTLLFTELTLVSATLKRKKLFSI